MSSTPDPAHLEGLIAPIGSFLAQRLALEIHPKKITIRKFSQGVDFLGYILLPHYRLVRTKTRQRIFRKFRKRISQYNAGLVTKQTLEQSLQSYLGVLSHANSYKLSERLKNQLWFY